MSHPTNWIAHRVLTLMREVGFGIKFSEDPEFYEIKEHPGLRFRLIDHAR